MTLCRYLETPGELQYRNTAESRLRVRVRYVHPNKQHLFSARRGTNKLRMKTNLCDAEHPQLNPTIPIPRFINVYLLKDCPRIRKQDE